MSNGEKRTSPWVFVGVGCLIAVFLVIAAIGSIVWYGFRMVREIEETMENPAARTEMALELLATDEIPEGYNALVAFSVPFLMETVVLSDREPDEDGRIEGFDERGFIWVKTLTFGEQERELRDFFEGRTDESALLEQQSIRVNAREFVGRGALEEAGRTLRYVSYRGDLDTSAGSELDEGLTSMILVECPDDERMRMGIWFGPDPDPDSPPDDADFSGSVADEAEIQAFMRPFDVCRR